MTILQHHIRRFSLLLLLSILLVSCKSEQSSPDTVVGGVAAQKTAVMNTPLPPTKTPTSSLSSFNPVVIIVPSPTASPSPVPALIATPGLTPTESLNLPEFGWLTLLNEYRTLSNLPPVGYSAELSDNAHLHSEYVGRNDDPAALSQVVGAPYYTVDGSVAAEKSMLFTINDPNGTDLWALNYWFSAPFHALTLLDPDLQQVGYGRFRDDFGSVQVAYVMDSLSGMIDRSNSVEYPIFYPPDGGTSHLTNQSFTEFPEPSASCLGFEKPIGPPLILQLGDGALTPTVTEYHLFVDDEEVEACVFDETNFVGASGGETVVGRDLLDSRDAVVLMPKRPLMIGNTVRAVVVVDGETHTWSYEIIEQPFIPFDAIPRSAPDWTVGDSVSTLGSIDLAGFNYGGQTHDFQNAALMSQSGMTWVKFQLKWRADSQPSEISERLGRAKAAGFNVLVSVTGDPYPTSIDYAAFTQFMGGLASLSPAPDAIEVWNEMNIDFEWPAGQIDPALYTEQMLAPAYQAIKAANPNIMVISGAPAPTGFDNGTNAWANSRYMNGMVAAGATNYMDCIGMHFNEGATPPTVTSGHPAGEYFGWYFIPSMQNTFFAFGGDVPLCFTELGYLSGDGYGGLPGNFWWAEGTSTSQQAVWLYESLGLAYQSGYVELAIVFNVDIFHFEDDPQGGFAIMRPGGGCPFCNLAAR